MTLENFRFSPEEREYYEDELKEAYEELYNKKGYYEVTYRREKRYILDILKKAGEEFGITVEEIPLFRGWREIEESYEARKARGDWSVRIIPPAGRMDLSDFWKRVRELEKEYLEKSREKEGEEK